MPEDTYTIIFERTDGKDTTTNQISGRNVDNVVASWIDSLLKTRLVSKKAREDILEWLEYMGIGPISGLLNVWCLPISLKGKSYLTNIVKVNNASTASTVFQKPLFRPSRGKGTYEHYRKEYLKLKSCDARDSKINAARRRAEKWMKYWVVKNSFLEHYNLLKDNIVFTLSVSV